MMISNNKLEYSLANNWVNNHLIGANEGMSKHKKFLEDKIESAIRYEYLGYAFGSVVALMLIEKGLIRVHENLAVATLTEFLFGAAALQAWKSFRVAGLKKRRKQLKKSRNTLITWALKNGEDNRKEVREIMKYMDKGRLEKVLQGEIALAVRDFQDLAIEACVNKWHS